MLDGNGTQLLGKLPDADTIGDSRLAARAGWVYWTSYTPHAIPHPDPSVKGQLWKAAKGP